MYCGSTPSGAAGHSLVLSANENRCTFRGKCSGSLQHIELSGRCIGSQELRADVSRFSMCPWCTATACHGSDPSQFPSSNLFGAAGDGIWDNGAACGRQYLVRCISASVAGTCIPSQTIQVRILDRAATSVSRPSRQGATIVLSTTAFGSIANPSATSINVEFQQWVLRVFSYRFISRLNLCLLMDCFLLPCISAHRKNKWIFKWFFFVLFNLFYNFPIFSNLFFLIWALNTLQVFIIKNFRIPIFNFKNFYDNTCLFSRIIPYYSSSLIDAGYDRPDDRKILLASKLEYFSIYEKRKKRSLFSWISEFLI